MRTLDIDQLYDAQFDNIPNGKEYSNFLGFVKNLFPKHTVVGKILGSTNTGKGIELGELFNNKHQSTPKTKYISVPTPPVSNKKDNTQIYMIGGGVLLIIVVLAIIFTHKNK